MSPDFPCFTRNLSQPENRKASTPLFYGLRWHIAMRCATILTGRASECALQRPLRHIDLLCEFRVGSSPAPWLTAQVDSLSGAGVLFGTGPAPRIGRTCFPLAQVPTPFPHLRQHHRIPAPITMATYARSLHPHTPTSPLCHFAKLPHGDTQ